LREDREHQAVDRWLHLTGSILFNKMRPHRTEQAFALQVQEVSNALARAGALIDQLQARLRDGWDHIESLEVQIQDAQQRADDALHRADLGEEQAKAIEACFDRLLKARLDTAEGKARRREWFLATLVALIVGLATIVIARYLPGLLPTWSADQARSCQDRAYIYRSGS